METTTERKLGKPAVSLATLQEQATDQAGDYRQIQKAAGRFEAELKKLTPETFSAEFLSQRKRELQKELDAAVEPALRRLADRYQQASAAREAWSPARRRLDAALGDPVKAAGLAGVLATASANDLPRLAADAAKKHDWLLAHAVLTRVSSLAAGPETLAIDHAVSKALEGMDAEDTGAVFETIGAIGRHYAQARILTAAVIGKPLSGIQQLELAHEHPGLMTPTLVPAA
jgi:hypothetical protein